MKKKQGKGINSQKNTKKKIVQEYSMLNVYSMSLMTSPCPHLFISLLLSFTFTKKKKIVLVLTWLHMINDREDERKVFPLL